MKQVVLIDFDHAVLMPEDGRGRYDRQVGTPGYNAPEVPGEADYYTIISRSAIDAWSVGIMLLQSVPTLASTQLADH
jgi:serine/threonine protein kinase